MNIQPFIYKIERECFLSYLDLMDKELNKQWQELKQWISKQKTKNLTTKKQADLDFIIEAKTESLNEYSNLLFESFAIWLYGYLENQLNGLCNRFTKHHSSVLQLSEVAGRGIERAKIFMKKICKWSLPEETLWEKLIYFREIRNTLVHNRGIIKEKKLKTFIDKQNDDEIFYWPDGKIALGKAYCRKAVDVVFTYLQRLEELKSNSASEKLK